MSYRILHGLADLCAEDDGRALMALFLSAYAVAGRFGCRATESVRQRLFGADRQSSLDDVLALIGPAGRHPRCRNGQGALAAIRDVLGVAAVGLV